MKLNEENWHNSCDSSAAAWQDRLNAEDSDYSANQDVVDPAPESPAALGEKTNPIHLTPEDTR